MNLIFFNLILFSSILISGCKSFETDEKSKNAPAEGEAATKKDLSFGNGFLRESDFKSQEKYSELLKDQLDDRINSLSDIFLMKQKPASKDLDICLSKLLKDNKSFKTKEDSFDWMIESLDVSSCFKQELYSDVKVKLKMKLAVYCEGDSLLNYEKNLMDAKQWNGFFVEVCRNGLYRGLLLQIQFGIEGQLKNKQSGGIVSSSQKEVKVSGKMIKSISDRNSQFCFSQRSSIKNSWSLSECQWFNGSWTTLDVLDTKSNSRSTQKLFDANRLLISQAKLDMEKQYLQDSQADFNVNDWYGKMIFTDGVLAPKWNLTLLNSSQEAAGVFSNKN